MDSKEILERLKRVATEKPKEKGPPTLRDEVDAFCADSLKAGFDYARYKELSDRVNEKRLTVSVNSDIFEEHKEAVKLDALTVKLETARKSHEKNLELNHIRLKV